MIAEILGPNGRVHYRRQPDDKMVEDSKKAPGYSVRLVENETIETPTVCGTIEIECRACGRKEDIARDEYDPPAAVRVQITCPDCNHGDFDETMHFDAKGRHLHPGTGLPF